MLITSDTEGSTACWHRQAQRELKYLIDKPVFSDQVICSGFEEEKLPYLFIWCGHRRLRVFYSP